MKRSLQYGNISTMYLKGYELNTHNGCVIAYGGPINLHSNKASFIVHRSLTFMRRRVVYIWNWISWYIYNNGDGDTTIVEYYYPTTFNLVMSDRSGMIMIGLYISHIHPRASPLGLPPIYGVPLLLTFPYTMMMD
jgi:hypothetical protein